MYCTECKTTTTEKLSFLSSPKARITKSMERTIVELRQKMSITDVASFFDIDWKTVKDCEKKYLGKKFKYIPLKNVKTSGIYPGS